jgi:hypothetical protein
MSGPFVYSKVDDLQGKPKVGTGECAVMPQWYAKAPGDAKETWRAGIRVKGNGLLIAKGTAVGTFVNDRWPRTKHHKHAALYVGQDSLGVWVMDQWGDNDVKPTISKRQMRFLGMTADGKAFKDPSNNGDALYVIMGEP